MFNIIHDIINISKYLESRVNMQYSKKNADKKDFSYGINNSEGQKFVRTMLDKRFKTLEYDENITAEEVEDAILFDQYICKLVAESNNKRLNSNQINSIKEYIKYILINYFQLHIINGESQLSIERLVSINEFPLFSSQFNQLENLFKNDLEVMNMLNIITTKRKTLISEIIIPIWQKYEHGEIITAQEKNLLARYFCANIPFQNEEMNKRGQMFFKNEVSRLIINENMPYISTRMLEFISKYAMFDRINSLLKDQSNLNINDYYFIYCKFLKNSSTYAFQSENKIVHGYKSFEKKNIYPVLEHIFSIYHETRHMLQYEVTHSKDIATQLSDLSVSYQLMNLYSHHLDYGATNEYKTNYSRQEVEHDANRNAYFAITLLLNQLNIPNETKIELLKKIKARYQQVQQKTQISFKSDEQGKKLISGDFRIGKLDEIVRKKPELVKKELILSYLYNPDGSYKDPTELLDKFNFAELHQNHNGANFILQYFLYRNSRNKNLFNNVLFSLDKKTKLENMFMLWREARNNLVAFNTKFDDYMAIPGYNKSDILHAINKKSTDLIDLMRSIYPVLIKGKYAEINPEFKKYYIDLDVMSEYENTYKEILTKIANYGTIQNNQIKPRR